MDKEILEKLAERVHIRWMEKRLGEGWTFGPQRSDDEKEHPCLVPYEELTEIEKEYDRATARETLEVLDELGYDLVKRIDDKNR
ncbi:hypothetical protein FUAX_49870 (plasmid) [Fulvitalea axinellae]|uniref:Ryanodine receptor Ryr domain-containing protein n=1 Tax=Fulvitalea axinellae TaxID=1182444 RepID=A0AAU9DJ00_9BACT|nr:hypothetical protein FUAX_49870 [Fulvitalea axinellae]